MSLADHIKYCINKARRIDKEQKALDEYYLFLATLCPNDFKFEKLWGGDAQYVYKPSITEDGSGFGFVLDRGVYNNLTSKKMVKGLIRDLCNSTRVEYDEKYPKEERLGK